MYSFHKLFFIAEYVANNLRYDLIGVVLILLFGVIFGYAMKKYDAYIEDKQYERDIRYKEAELIAKNVIERLENSKYYNYDIISVLIVEEVVNNVNKLK